ncbi:ABC transporter permease [Siculibacillus lacustris]|uniref:Autoinducer 2 import system permease protein LsrC n=1 Tax=Siculibacillus lacustris TaxID=1549641 RepID=A0A4Q9VWM6_9HYPH|nr:ABC transporter permease [Siculibacillus lacustris]TBW40735.1 ABC transporter permease [Siculibacillus lacustris]
MSEAPSVAARPGSRNLVEVVLRLREAGVVVFLVVLGLAFGLATDRFLSVQNLTTVASSAAILAIAACAQAIVLITRNLDVSVGSMMGLVAYLTADWAATHPGITPVEVVAIPLMIGTVLGAINGLLVAYGRVPALIATLGTMSLYRGFTYIYAHGQEVTSSRLPPWMLSSVDARIGGLPILILVSIAIVAVVAWLLHAYPFGRRLYAVGSNGVAAWFFGLRAERVVFFAYVACGFLCGIAGLLYAARVGTVTVVLANGWEMSSLASAVIGGVSVSGGSGTVVGAALGAVVLATIDNGLVLLRVPEFWRMFIQGAAIVAAVAVDALIAEAIRRSTGGRRR